MSVLAQLSMRRGGRGQIGGLGVEGEIRVTVGVEVGVARCY